MISFKKSNKPKVFMVYRETIYSHQKRNKSTLPSRKLAPHGCQVLIKDLVYNINIRMPEKRIPLYH
jgi:hypothetical protein